MAANSSQRHIAQSRTNGINGAMHDAKAALDPEIAAKLARLRHQPIRDPTDTDNYTGASGV
jgi:hypothetical protein